jgi:hypothetical protein
MLIIAIRIYSQLSDDNLVFSVTEVTEIPENPSFNKRFESIVRNMTRKEVINILGLLLMNIKNRTNVLIKICVIIVSSRDELFNFNYNTFAAVFI